MPGSANNGSARRSARSSSKPKISVVMPVHNALPYLDEAVESILGQTFDDFEFVIFDDSSTDESTARLREWASKHPRIRLVEGKKRLGPAASSERVAREARAPVVARMDADDICTPDRLSAQFEVLSRDRAIGAVGCLSDIIDVQGRVVRSADLWRLKRKSSAVPFAHGATMYRREIYDRVGGYDKECDYWEDQELLTRIAQVSKVVTLPTVLYSIRQTATSTRAATGQEKLEMAMDRSYRSMEGMPPGNGKILPKVFIALGSVTLWSGGRPRLFRRCIDRAELRWSRQTVSALVWTAWANVSPGTLRGTVRLALSVRNAIAKRRLGSQPVPWVLSDGQS
jgi:GT2 family glycosyltransferase